MVSYVSFNSCLRSILTCSAHRIEANYTPSRAKFNFMDHYSAYKKVHPQDPVRPSGFAEMINELYPQEADAPQTKDNVSSTSRAKISIADVEDTADTPQRVLSESIPLSTVGPLTQDASLHPGERVPIDSQHPRPRPAMPHATQNPDGHLHEPQDVEVEILHSQPASSKSERPFIDGISKSQKRRSLPWKAEDRTSQQSPIPRTTSDSTQLPLQPTLVGKVDGITESARASNIEVGELPGLPKAAVANVSRLVIPPGTTAPLSPFAEFARAWKNIRPGGAFASRESQEQMKRKSERQINVLAWEL